MSYYSINTMKQTGRAYESLVALPLAIVTVFCFGFVMMQSHAKLSPTASTAALSNSHPVTSNVSPAIVQLSAAPPKLSMATQASSASAADTVTTSDSTSSQIQAASPDDKDGPTTITQQSSTTSTTNLQSAAPANPEVINNVVNSVNNVLSSLRSL